MQEIKPGQVWICPSAGEAPPLLCIVGRIDTIALPTTPPSATRVISVTIRPAAAARDAGWPAISHLPLTAQAFRASGLMLTEHTTPPSAAFTEGHGKWWAKVEQGKAGPFDQPLSQAYLGIAGSARR